MPTLHYRIIDGIDQFQEIAQDWNFLWENSQAYELGSRAEGILAWVQQFARGERFIAVLVYEGNQLVGGIPLLKGSVANFDTLHLPVNCWSHSGDILLHTASDHQKICRTLLAGLTEVRPSFLYLADVQTTSARWQTFANCIQAAGGEFGISRQRDIGFIEIGPEWEPYFGCLSSNHRSAVRRNEKQARKQGCVELCRYSDVSAASCEQLMLDAFRIENSSWKGSNASSILASPGMPEFFIAEAERARQANMLELWFLKLDGQSIAFEYCHRVKNTCHSHKIGYDEQFKRIGPGRLLRKLQLETLFREHPNSRFDTKGVLCQAKAKWVTRTFPIGCLYASISGPFSKMLVQLTNATRPLVKRLAHGSPEPIKLGGSGYVPIEVDSLAMGAANQVPV